MSSRPEKTAPFIRAQKEASNAGEQMEKQTHGPNLRLGSIRAREIGNAPG
jgi:hypothetical protein